MSFPQNEDDIYKFGASVRRPVDDVALTRARRDANDGWEVARAMASRSEVAERMAHMLADALAEAIKELPSAHGDCKCDVAIHSYLAWKNAF